jgi:dTDP-4-amino-4,6-dideoxygalactose transaminase
VTEVIPQCNPGASYVSHKVEIDTAVKNVLESCGATPVLIDIKADSFTMDPDNLEHTINSINGGKSSIKGRPRAIIPVHIYGHPADMAAIMDIANRYGLYVVEDCAQSHGAAFNGKMTGSFGQMAAFSFYPTKNLGAIGDGGMVVTNDQKLQQKLTALRQYGWQQRYVSSIRGINSRLDELQAAVLRVKLGDLENDNKRRKQIAEIYTKAIENTKIIPPRSAKGIVHVYHQYVIRTENRDALIRHLANNSIVTAIHYPLPVHLQPAYKDKNGIKKNGLPVTEEVCTQIISLPMYPQMTNAQVSRVVDALSTQQKQKARND